MDEGILTGEGVLLEGRPASFASRALASMLDLAVLVVALVLLVWLVSTTSWVIGEDGAAILAIVAVAGVTVVLPTTVETLSRGRSLGKLAAGIRIVRDDGGAVTVRQCLIRALVGVLELWATFGSVALITSIVHPRGKRLGDVLAGTYAVRVRGKTTQRAAVPMPPHLVAWAATADIARLPDGLALAVRQFLVRAPGLHPASRATLGTTLTAQVQERVRPLPPAGTHPEDFLAAVVAARRERDLAVLLARHAQDEAEQALLARLPHGVPDPPR